MESLKIFLSETTRPRALIFSVASSSGPTKFVKIKPHWGQNRACLGWGSCFTQAYIGKRKKSSETTRPRALIFGM